VACDELVPRARSTCRGMSVGPAASTLKRERPPALLRDQSASLGKDRRDASSPPGTGERTHLHGARSSTLRPAPAEAPVVNFRGGIDGAHDSCSNRQLTTVYQKLHIGPDGGIRQGPRTTPPPESWNRREAGKTGVDGHFQAGFEEQVRSECTRRGRRQHQFAGARSS
jgi:hypothetical protein